MLMSVIRMLEPCGVIALVVMLSGGLVGFCGRLVVLRRLVVGFTWHCRLLLCRIARRTVRKHTCQAQAQNNIFMPAIRVY